MTGADSDAAGTGTAHACPGGRLLVVSGPGAVGKGTVIAELARRRSDIVFSVSATTRAARPGEVDGVHYHFLDRARFEEMAAAGEFLEWAEFNSHLYGTPWTSVCAALAEGNVVVLDIEMQGARQVQRRFGEAVLVFLEPPSLDALAERLRERGDDEAAVARRMAIARRQIEQEAPEFDHVVLNDRLERAVEDISGIIDGLPA